VSLPGNGCGINAAAMSWRERGKRFGIFCLKNLDALAIVVVCFGVLLLQVLGSPKPDLLDSAILAVLGVLAIALIRDRWGRSNLAALEEMARDSVSDRPFEVVWQKNRWDITDRNSVRVKTTEQLRFTRNEVATIAHWSRGPGEVVSTEAKWRRDKAHDWMKADELGEIEVRQGLVIIFSFGREHNRGDMVEWTIEREIHGRFPKPNESVGVIAAAHARHPRVMRVIWPPDAGPHDVGIKYGEHGLLRPLKPDQENGRRFVEEKLSELGIGEEVDIVWNW
jgi:hypothetical protein